MRNSPRRILSFVVLACSLVPLVALSLPALDAAAAVLPGNPYTQLTVSSTFGNDVAADLLLTPDKKSVISQELRAGVYVLRQASLGGGSYPPIVSAVAGTAGGGVVGAAKVTADGTFVVYRFRDTPTAKFVLKATNLNSGQTVTFVGTGSPVTGVSSFDLTPDGRFVVFKTDSGGQQILFGAAVDGSTAPVMLHESIAAEPGKNVAGYRVGANNEVVFVIYDFPAALTQIRAIKADGSNARVIRPAGVGVDPILMNSNLGQMEISRDGLWVTYVLATPPFARSRLLRTPISGVGVASNTVAIDGFDNVTESVIDFKFSPDGARVTYRTTNVGNGQNEYRSRFFPEAIGYDGIGRGTQATDPNYVATNIGAVVGFTNAGVRRFDVIGYPTTYPPAGSPGPGPLVPGGSVGQIQVTPDGETIVFLADKLVDEQFEMFAVKYDGTNMRKLSQTDGSDTDVELFGFSPDGLSVVGRSSNAALGYFWDAPISGATPASLVSARTITGFAPSGLPVGFGSASDRRWVYNFIGADAQRPTEVGVIVSFRRQDRVSKFVALPPARVLDTRPGAEQIGYAGAKPSAGQTVRLALNNVGGLPSYSFSGTLNASAVVLNITATESTAAGFVTVFPTGSSRPTASNLNLEVAGQTRPNLVTVPLPSNNVPSIDIFTQNGTHLIADVMGYYVEVGFNGYASTGYFKGVQPTRLLDTRPGPSQLGYTGVKPQAGESINLRVGGKAGLPAASQSIDAVVLNVTATEATAAGFVTVYPQDIARPKASNLNLESPGQTIPNQVIVPVSPGSLEVTLFTQSGTHLIVDIVGYYQGSNGGFPSSAGLYVPAGPLRLTDTRPGVTQVGYSGPKPIAGGSVSVDPALPSASAVIMNVTLTEATAAGFVTVFPSDTTRPLASNLNATQAGQTIPNHTIVALGSNQRAAIFTQNGTHLIADLLGWFTG